MSFRVVKLGVYQFNPKIGDFAGNTQNLLGRVEDAKKAGADLLLLPELCLTGYPPRDFLEYPSFIDQNLKALEKCAAAARGIAVICGFVDRGADGRLYNAAAVLQDGKVSGRYHKQLLPNYDVFDEPRHFTAGNTPLIATIAGKRVGVTICEDAWNFPGFVPHLYGTQPLDALKGKVDLVVNLSASPFDLGKPDRRVELFKKGAALVGAPIVCCAQVGANDELIFDGSSFGVSPSGEVLFTASPFVETLVVTDLGKAGPRGNWPTTEAEWLEKALVLGIADYARKTGSRGVCLGLSGGIDSSVVAVLAVRALGPQAVSGVALPTRFTSKASLEDAETLAKRLGIAYSVFSIESTFEHFMNGCRDWLGETPRGVTAENVQPRLRMTALMTLANHENRLLLNTSNKSEIAAGYATLYGDSSGALAVLGDLTKRQIYLLAEHFNRAGEIIARRVLERAPTAELRENQTDQDTLPPYAELDPLVVDAVEKFKLPKGAHAAKFASLHAASEYKRRQLPPALRVSSRAFGMGRRMPISAASPIKEGVT